MGQWKQCLCLAPKKCSENELNVNAYQNGRHCTEFLFLALVSENWLLDCQEMLSQTVMVVKGVSLQLPISSEGYMAGLL